MSKYEIPFLTACINAFGQRFSMTRQAAFRYLHKYKGLAFLIEFYDVEHLQSMDETIDDLLIVCHEKDIMLKGAFYFLTGMGMATLPMWAIKTKCNSNF